MSDILLIQPPIRDFYLTRKRTVPYGLASIAAALRESGFSVEILDALATAKSRIIPWPAEMEFLHPFYGRSDRSPFGLFHHYRHFGYAIDHIAQKASRSGAFLIGIASLFSAYADTALETAAAVKRLCPHCLIVLGGHHPTALPEAVMAHPAVDFVIRGDGEAVLPRLAEAIRNGTGRLDIPGLVRRRPGGDLALPPPARIDDLDGLPLPAMDLVNWKYYQRAGLKSYALNATRGCPMRCTYCAVNAASFHDLRVRDVTSVMKELEAVRDHPTLGFIDFEDENLCARKSWAMTLMQRIVTRFGVQGLELRAMNGLYAPALDAELLAWMRRAGFKTLNLALISTRPDQLRRFGRPDIGDDVRRVLHLARPLGLDCVVYLIVAGPDQDPEGSVDDLLFLAGRRTLAGVSVFYPAPGSADYRWCRERGLLPPTSGLLRATALPLRQATRRTQAVTLLRLGRILNFVKYILDQGETLPAPGRIPARINPSTGRMAVGRQLLSAFLRDGSIWGLDQSGGTYEHRIDERLTRRFLLGLGRIRLRGTVH